VGQAALLVVRLNFAPSGGSSSQASLYVNPPAGTLPTTPSASATTTNSIAFQSIAWNAGSVANQSSLDEIRVAATYTAITSGAVPPPPTPSNLAAIAGNRQVSLSWNPVSGATAYQVFQGVNTAMKLESTVTTNSFSDTGLTNGTQYTYYVVAVTPSGQSAPSSQVTAIPRGPAPAAHPSLGTNLSAIGDCSRELPFVDVFRSARAWIPQLQGASWGQGPPLQLDPNGWITSLQSGQYAETIMLDNALDDQSDYPAGQYTLLYDGDGVIEFDLQSAVIVSQTPGRMVVDVPAGENGVFLMVTATNAANPIRNIHFIMPGFESTYQTQPFNPTFLQRLQNYDVLRFMEWTLTNGSMIQNWSDRATPSDYTFGWRGVPLEVLIQLADALKVSPWFNLPAQATDDYLLQFANMVKTQLDPNLRFYIEYSNETWNGSFSQNAWVQSRGIALGFSTNPTIAAADFTGWRATQMFGIFQTAFGSTRRFVRVIAAQAGNSWLSDQTLAFQNSFNSADALAIAPYFNCDDTATGGFGTLGDPATANQVAQMTVNQIIDIELGHINGCALQQMQSNSAVAQKYGIKMLAYEGGESLAAYNGAENNTALVAQFKAASRNSRMSSLYAQYLQNWITAGGDILVHFTDVTAYTKYGDFGSMEYQDQDPATAPKYQALTTFATQHP
jgi:hypothetical protein